MPLSFDIILQVNTKFMIDVTISIMKLSCSLFSDGDVPCSISFGVYISQLIRFARASSHVVDFNTCDKLLTPKLLKQGYRYHTLRKTFSQFYRRYYDLISRFNTLAPQTFGDLVYLKKIVDLNNFSVQASRL